MMTKDQARKKAAAQMGLQTKFGFLYEGEAKIPLSDPRQDRFLELVEELVQVEELQPIQVPEWTPQEVALQRLSDHTRRFFFRGGILMVRYIGRTYGEKDAYGDRPRGAFSHTQSERIAVEAEREQYRKILNSLQG